MAFALSASARAADSAPVSLSNVQVEFRDGLRSDGKQYPRMSVDVLVNKKPAKGMGLSCKASCQVGGKKMSDKALAMAKWDELDEGETKRVDLAPFVGQPLDAQPSSCEFSVRWGKLFGGDPKEVAKFCWTPEGVKDGACPKAK
jgi:hypothetical protein